MESKHVYLWQKQVSKTCCWWSSNFDEVMNATDSVVINVTNAINMTNTISINIASTVSIESDDKKFRYKIDCYKIKRVWCNPNFI